MKKFAAVLFASLLAVSFTACGEPNTPAESHAPVSDTSSAVSEASPTEESISSSTSSEASSTPSTEESVPTSDTRLFQKYLDYTKDGVFYVDMLITTTEEGLTAETTPMIVATDGTKVYMSTALLGIDMVLLDDGTNIYMLDKENKAAYQMDKSSVSIDASNSGLADTYQFIETGTTDYNGTSCTYEKYSADGIEQCMYFDADGNLIAFESEVDDTKAVYTINAFTNEIPEGILEIPSDYIIDTTLSSLYEGSQSYEDAT